MIRSFLKCLVVLLFIGWLPSLCANPLNPNEIVGTLTIHSDIEGATSSSSIVLNIRGHSWLGFDSIDGKTSWTVGTWDEGISVGNRISTRGVNFNLEEARRPGAYRRATVTREQYARLATAIVRNNDWTSVRNCSFFTSTVWNEVTDENLKNWSPVQDQELREFIVGNDFGVSRTVPLPSPSGLFDWIFMSNGHKFNNDNNALRDAYKKADLSVQDPAP